MSSMHSRESGSNRWFGIDTLFSVCYSQVTIEQVLDKNVPWSVEVKPVIRFNRFMADINREIALILPILLPKLC
jgi:hypothetical protein